MTPVFPILVGSKTSPYSRRLRLLLLDQPHEFKAINYLENPEDTEYLRRLSPINKIPVLIDGENKIFESRVIANYLLQKYSSATAPWLKLSIDEENVLSMIDAVSDVAVNLFLLRRGGIDIGRSNWFFDRQNERVSLIFDQVAPWAKSRDEKNPAHWNYVTMSLFSYVDWAVFRGMADFSRHPELTDFVARFSSKPGVDETSPRL